MINVTQTGTITDVNITDLYGLHDYIEDLKFTSKVQLDILGIKFSLKKIEKTFPKCKLKNFEELKKLTKKSELNFEFIPLDSNEVKVKLIEI